eukprot:CAMPEP_0114445318 /NCGR_PEP_ID=MMETSP0103-20121206/18559_1 /TAXON_ID=37642 ORGANISM="Paraphysomonas imperforata, Strain PA2" /NCGR_SAMPLE_ID=MMETSP0103 /ASSEMBLY_ACC=CAM_ASM_000201 /LENGTH=265 /DNA_ID=CAMNT_0001616921 /DNA_START=269 /DNA_END=1066 /DNA_ORIENTATION=+
MQQSEQREQSEQVIGSLKRSRDERPSFDCQGSTDFVQCHSDEHNILVNSPQSVPSNGSGVTGGASFLEKRCLFWASRVSETAEVIDGNTGFLDTSEVSIDLVSAPTERYSRGLGEPSISSASLFRQYLKCNALLRQRVSGGVHCSYSIDSMSSRNVKLEDNCHILDFVEYEEFSPAIYKFVKQYGDLPSVLGSVTERGSGTNEMRNTQIPQAYSLAKEQLFRNKHSFLHDVDRLCAAYCVNCGRVSGDILDGERPQCCGKVDIML